MSNAAAAEATHRRVSVLPLPYYRTFDITIDR
jgi:hypothetical protein